VRERATRSCASGRLASSQQTYLRALEELVALGAQGVVLGCTELMLLVGPARVDVPLFDTTTLHAEAAVDYALGESGLAAAQR